MREKPNIVLVMADQLRADFLHCYGCALETMPCVDRLAAEGVGFRRAYTPMPVCGPARVSLLTGRFPRVTGVRENGATRHAVYETDVVGVLRARGYRTLLVGKNDSHLRPVDFDAHVPYGHRGRGGAGRGVEEAAFEAWLAGLDREGETTPGPRPAPFPARLQTPHRLVDDAIRCVERVGREPFFLWLSFPEPHNPYQVSEPYFSLFPEDRVPERIAGVEALAVKGPRWRWLQRLLEEKRPGYDTLWRRYRATYCGMMRLIDDELARFLAHLERGGLAGNTVVLFLSDHGDFAGDFGLQRKGVGLPECLVRVPLIVAGPGIMAQPGLRDELVSLVDVLPTLCDLAGAPLPYGVQGTSLLPLLRGAPARPGRLGSMYAEAGFGGAAYGEGERPPLHFPYEGTRFDELNTVTQGGRTKMLRTARWKLLYERGGATALYDLESDPGELCDLAGRAEFGAVRAELMEELLRWAIETEDDLPVVRYQPKGPTGTRAF